jgi:hypothetical protein
LDENKWGCLSVITTLQGIREIIVKSYALFINKLLYISKFKVLKSLHIRIPGHAKQATTKKVIGIKLLVVDLYLNFYF